MESSALKDLLEFLLTEHNERLMGGSVKHFGSDHCNDLYYKEVLPANNAVQPQNKTPETQQSAAETKQTCNIEAYQNYAANALKNCACPNTNTTQSETASFSSITVETTDVQIEQLVRQQLERIEQMIREMYTTNQELFKSIISYCREHTDDV